MSLTDTQKAALEELRKKMSDVLTEDQMANDHYLLRFLRAREYNVPLSEKMIKDEVNWRKANKIDLFLATYKKPEIIQKFYSIQRLGMTKNKSILWLMRFDQIDFKGMLHCMKLEEVRNAWIWAMEESVRAMKEETEKTGTLVDQHYLLMDMSQFQLSQVTYKDTIMLFRDMALILDSYYPETLEKSTVINATTVFFIAWSLVKPFLHPVTIAKVHILSPQDDWKKFLLNDIEADVLPEHWGGTRTDGTGDPTCPSLISPGGLIPKELYTVSAAKQLKELEGVETITVAGGSTAMIEADITQAGSTIKWIFGTKDHDIAFGLYRKTSTGLEEHSPKERLNCSQFAEEGELECREAGTYVLCFDNSHSMVRAKTVMFKVEVLPPDETLENKIVERRKSFCIT